MLRFFKSNKLESQDFGFYQKITPDESVKKSILDFILNDTDFIILDEPGGKISKTNWIEEVANDPDTHKKRQKRLNKIFNKHFGKIFRDYFEQPATLIDMWYQVYNKHSGSFHDYHDHAGKGSHVSAIFYVKLHSKDLLTHFRIGNSIITPDAQEGDIIFFDSKIFHASPPNDTDHDKIIVSFNFNLKNHED